MLLVGQTACSEVSLAMGDTVILFCCWLPLAAIDCHSLGIYAVILLSLLSFSAKMTVPPHALGLAPERHALRAGVARAGADADGDVGGLRGAADDVERTARRSGPRPVRAQEVAFSTVNRFHAACLCGRAGRLTALSGGCRPGQ